ncbi:MAG: YcbK family protein [Myxococcota bacterium]
MSTPPKSIKRKSPQQPNSPPAQAEKVISLRQHHTKEILPLGNPSQKLVNLFFRCRITGKTTKMDLKLIKILRETSLHFDAEEIIIISAFRAPRYNEELRKKLHEVALRSKHLFGQAVDFALKGVDTARVARYLRKRKIGGVGYYNRSKFIHFDTGPVRTWNGL